jgi:hypothetical protein
LAILSPPFGAEFLNDGDTLIGRHSQPEFGVGFRFVLERVEAAKPQIHLMEFSRGLASPTGFEPVLPP